MMPGSWPQTTYMEDIVAAGFKSITTEAAYRDAAVVLQAAARNTTRAVFPFGNPVSIERRHLAVFEQLPYWVAQKTNGCRVALLFGRSVTDAPCAYMMSRAGDLFGLPCSGAAAQWVFRDGGTLLDGELVRCDATGAWFVLVFDAALIGGVSLAPFPLSERLQGIASVCEAFDDGGALTLRPKTMWRLGATTPGVVAHPGDFAVDGYILTPELDGPTGSGTAEAVFKIKAVHTLDVLLADGALLYGSAGDVVDVCTLRPVVTVVGLPTTPQERPVVVEVAITAVDAEHLELTFVMARPHKATPNNVRCVRRTLVSAMENVTLEDVFASR